MAVHKIKWVGKDRKSWKAQRDELTGVGDIDKVRFGSSEISIMCDDFSWAIPRKFWHIKVGIHQEDFNSIKLIAGHKMEPIIAEMFESWSPDEEQFVQDYDNGVKHRKLQKCNYFLINDKYPHLIASLDRRVSSRYPDPITGEKIKGGYIVELKSVSEFVFKNWGGELSPAYYYQVQEQMMVAEVSKAYVAVLVGNSDFHLFEVEADPKIQEYIDHKTTEFALSVLKGKVIYNEIQKTTDDKTLGRLWEMIYELEPELVGNKAEQQYLEGEVYPDPDNTLVYAGGKEEEELMHDYISSTKLVGELEKRKQLIRNKLTDIAGDFEQMEAGSYKMTNRRGREGKRGSFSIKEIK